MPRKKITPITPQSNDAPNTASDDTKSNNVRNKSRTKTVSNITVSHDDNHHTFTPPPTKSTRRSRNARMNNDDFDFISSQIQQVADTRSTKSANSTLDPSIDISSALSRINSNRDPQFQFIDPRHAFKAEFYSRAALEFINGGGEGSSNHYTQDQLISAYMNSVYLYAAINRVKNLISRVKIVAEIKRGGVYERTDESHHLNQLFSREGSRVLSGMWLNYAIYGSAVVYKVKTRRAEMSMQSGRPIYRYDEGAVAGLEVIDKPQYEIIENARQYVTGLYVHQQNSSDGVLNSRNRLEREEFIYVTDWNPNDRNRGKSIVSHAIHEAVTNSAIASWAADYFTRGAMPFILLNMEDDPAMMTEADLRKYKRQFEEYSQGKDASLRSVFVDRKITAQQIGIAASEVAATDLNEAALEGISATVGLDRELIVTPSGGSQARHKELVQRAWNDTIIPLAKLFLEAIERDLGLAEGMRLVLDLSDISELEADRADKSSTEMSIFDGGLQTYNEARGRMGMKAIGYMRNFIKMDGQIVHITQMERLRNLPPRQLQDAISGLYDSEFITRQQAQMMLGLPVRAGERDGYRSELERYKDDDMDSWREGLMLKSDIMRRRGIKPPIGMVDGFYNEIENYYQSQMDKHTNIMDLYRDNIMKRSAVQRALGVPINPSDIDGYSAEIDAVTGEYFRVAGEKAAATLEESEEAAGDSDMGGMDDFGGDDSGGFDFGNEEDTGGDSGTFGENSPDEFGGLGEDVSFGEDELETGDTTDTAGTVGDVSPAPSATPSTQLPASAGTQPVANEPSADVAQTTSPTQGQSNVNQTAGTSGQTQNTQPTSATPNTPISPRTTPSNVTSGAVQPAQRETPRITSDMDTPLDTPLPVPSTGKAYNINGVNRSKGDNGKYKTPQIRRTWWDKQSESAGKIIPLHKPSDDLSNITKTNVLNDTFAGKDIHAYRAEGDEEDTAGTVGDVSPAPSATPQTTPTQATSDTTMPDDTLNIDDTAGLEDEAQLTDDNADVSQGAGENMDSGDTEDEGILPEPTFTPIVPVGVGDIVDEVMEISAGAIDDPLATSDSYNAESVVNNPDTTIVNNVERVSMQTTNANPNNAIVEIDSQQEVYASLMLNNNPTLINLVTRLMPNVLNVSWEDSSKYHITVTYGRMSTSIIDEEGYPTTDAMHVVKQMPDEIYLTGALRASGMTVFHSENDSRYYLVLLLERSTDLRLLNKNISDVLSGIDGDIELSRYSNPMWYTPHITLASSEIKINAPNIYLGDMSFIPDSMTVSGTGYRIFYRAPVIIGDNNGGSPNTPNNPTNGGGGSGNSGTHGAGTNMGKYVSPRFNAESIQKNRIGQIADTLQSVAPVLTNLIGGDTVEGLVNVSQNPDSVAIENINQGVGLGEVQKYTSSHFNYEEHTSDRTGTSTDVNISSDRLSSDTDISQGAGEITHQSERVIYDDKDHSSTDKARIGGNPDSLTGTDMWPNDVSGALFTSNPEDYTDDGFSATSGRLSGAEGEADITGDTWDNEQRLSYNQADNVVAVTVNAQDEEQALEQNILPVKLPAQDDNGKHIISSLAQYNENVLSNDMVALVHGDTEPLDIASGVNVDSDGNHIELDPRQQFVDLNGDGKSDTHLDIYDENDISLNNGDDMLDNHSGLTEKQGGGVQLSLTTENADETIMYVDKSHKVIAHEIGTKIQELILSDLSNVDDSADDDKALDNVSEALDDILSIVDQSILPVENQELYKKLRLTGTYTVAELLKSSIGLPVIGLMSDQLDSNVSVPPAQDGRASQQTWRDELRAWRTAAMKSYNKALKFETLLLSPKVSNSIREALEFLQQYIDVPVLTNGSTLDKIKLQEYRAYIGVIFSVVDNMVKLDI